MTLPADQFPVLYSVVVAVYNSSSTLQELRDRLAVVFEFEIKATYELVFVNDCSPNPATASTLENLQKQFPEVKVIQLARNFGQHAATLCGIRYATGQYIITLDDDLQHLPEELPKLIAQQYHDVVFANFNEPEQPLKQRLGSSLKAWLDRKLFDKPVAVRFSPFRLISRPVADYLASCQVPYPYLPALILQATQDVVSVNVNHGKRPEGRSGYTL